MERTIIQQIVSAIEPKYLRALRQPGTHRLQKTIPEILTHLFETYRDVTPQDLRKTSETSLTLRVENLSYPRSEPVDTNFAEIDDLASIAEIASSPITAAQKSIWHIYSSRKNKFINQLSPNGTKNLRMIKLGMSLRLISAQLIKLSDKLER